MEKQHPKEWTLRCERCSLNGASCWYRHYPLPTLEEALKVSYPKEHGKVKPYRATYENGTDKPSFEKPAHLPAPRERSKSPKGGAKTPTDDSLAGKIAKQKSMEPQRCLAMMNSGNCPDGDKCPKARHHGKTKEVYAGQMKRWQEKLDMIQKQ